MESKEALQYIIDAFNKYANKPEDIGIFFKFCDAHRKVKQDLEVLDLLKYFIQVEYEKADDTYWIKLGKYGGTLTNKETYEKIKNWLERKE